MLPLDAHPTPDACGACTDHMTPRFEPAVGSTSGTAFVCAASHPRMQHPVQGNMRGGCASTTWTNTNSTATTASSRPWKPITPRPALAVSCVCAAKSLTQKGPRGDCHVCSFGSAYSLFCLRRCCYWLGGRRFASCRLLLERLGGGEWHLVSSTALGRELSLGDDGTGGLALLVVPPHSSTRSTRSGLSCSVVEGLALPLAGRPLEPGLSVSCVRFGVDRPWMAFFTFRLAFCASCLACSTYRCRVS
mgnify:CR=1 FL=1